MVDWGWFFICAEGGTRLWLTSPALGEHAAAYFIPEPCEACFVLWVRPAGFISIWQTRLQGHKQ